MADETDPLLDVAGVAALIGVEKPASVRTYLYRARQKRAAGTATAADLPEPDEVYGGRTPVWRRSTIEKWRRARAGLPNVRDVPPAD